MPPGWAVVSTLVVSQESVDQTHYTLRWQAIGTVIGAAVATGWMTALSRDVDHQIMAMTLAVATCAAIARRWPLLRVAMWTAAMVTLRRPRSTALSRPQSSAPAKCFWAPPSAPLFTFLSASCSCLPVPPTVESPREPQAPSISGTRILCFLHVRAGIDMARALRPGRVHASSDDVLGPYSAIAFAPCHHHVEQLT